jgi:hypothetical protein
VRRGSYQYPNKLAEEEKKDMDENSSLIISIALLMFFLWSWWAA